MQVAGLRHLYLAANSGARREGTSAARLARTEESVDTTGFSRVVVQLSPSVLSLKFADKTGRHKPRSHQQFWSI